MDLEPKDGKTHLAKVFAWSREEPVDWVAILASAIGMAGPVLLGAGLGRLGLGLTMAVGSLLVGGVGAGHDRRVQLRALAAALIPASAVAAVAALVAGHGWISDVVMTLFAGAAALVAAIGRPVAPLAIRFILLMVITFAVAENVSDRGGLLLLIAAGALWTCAVSLFFGALARAKGGADAASEQAPPPMTLRQRLTRWRRALGRLAGWQYALRLVLCLAVASLLKWLWPDHHMHWVALTVALLAEWQIDAFPVKTTQRALGAALGVLATGLLLLAPLPAWALAIGIGVLAGLRPLLRARNYLAYTAAMTPLIIVLLDAGATPGIGILIDRLVATLIGAGLVIATNLLFGRILRSSAGS
jgi:Fusaric acid resistance protein-like